jgi:hypothetical protein
MAVQAYQKIETKWYGYPALMYRWILTNGDTGAPARIPVNTDITVQARGTMGAGGTVVMEGTLDDVLAPATASYGNLHKTDLTNASLTITGSLLQVLEHPLQIRPNCTAGDGTTAITIDVLVVRQYKD